MVQKRRAMERPDLKLAAQIAVLLKIRFNPDELKNGVTVRLSLGPSCNVTPEQLRNAFKGVAALADIEKTHLIIERKELIGEVFHIDSIETDKKA